MKKDKKRAIASFMRLSLLLLYANFGKVNTAGTSMIFLTVIHYRFHIDIILFVVTIKLTGVSDFRNFIPVQYKFSHLDR